MAVPGVLEAIALGVPDPRLGAAVRLLLRGKPGVDPTQLENDVRGHLKQDLPNFMQPRDIRFVDAFPANANGKIDRVAVAREHGE